MKEQSGKKGVMRMARYIFGRSVKGASHVRSGMPCQDSLRIEEVSSKLSIIAAADGHGSDKSPRSDRGSTIAVKCILCCNEELSAELCCKAESADNIS